MTIPTHPPTANELRQDTAVQQALEQAWIDSLAHDPARRHEEGGWIYLNLKTGELAVPGLICADVRGLGVLDAPDDAVEQVAGGFAGLLGLVLKHVYFPSQLVYQSIRP